MKLVLFPLLNVHNLRPGGRFFSRLRRLNWRQSLYAMFRPMYLFPRDGVEPSIIDHCVLFRGEWKVHGSSDAVNLPVEIGL